MTELPAEHDFRCTCGAGGGVRQPNEDHTNGCRFRALNAAQTESADEGANTDHAQRDIGPESA